ncbi:MAG: DcaP family trimeric outer membrane transporter [Cyclobacteriaceae bacterium]
MKKIIFVVFAFSLLMNFSANAQEKSEAATELPPGWWMIPKTTTQIKVGGYVKFDLIHDFNPIASPDFFDVSKIPTDGSEGQSTNLNAKETRLYLDVKTPSKVGDIRTYVEGDFYGSSGGFRLRHAFIEINNKWLAGQTWSNFMDENIVPNTLDFEKPSAYAFARHPMFRYKQNLSSDAYVAFAVEQPNTSAQAPAAAGSFESPMPDITGRYRLTKPWGHVQLSAFAAKLVYRFAAGGTDEVSLFGGNLSGQFNLFDNKDKFTYQVVYGPGSARFRGGLAAGLDENGDLEALTDMGITIAYEHKWNSSFSSLLLYNQGEVDNSAGQAPTSIKGVDYVATNLIWNFAERAMAGVEYLWGLREDLNGEDGTANRVQFSVKYTFN